MQAGSFGKGRGNTVVDSDDDCSVEKLRKDLLRCHAKSERDLMIHLGKQMAHVEKSIEYRSLKRVWLGPLRR